MIELVLCEECNRHVRGDACPFCGARVFAARSSVIVRASRAALFAIAASGCNKETPVEAHDAAITTAPSAPASVSAPIVVETTPSAAPSATASASAAPSATASARPKPVMTAPAIRPAITAYGGPPTHKPEL